MAATFFICLFILLMQFLWRFIDDIVGKGLEGTVVAEFFLYAAGWLIPMALPLSILLASIMTFGNMGEKLELLSMKAAGISLFRIMRPLIILVVFVSIGAFFFSNEVFPIIQSKFALLQHDIKRKNPELNLKEDVFNNEIANLSVRISKKNRETGMLYDIMIYDHRNTNDNSNVTLADSGKISLTKDERFMILTLYDGKSYEQFKEDGKRYDKRNKPFKREEFGMREVLIEMPGFERTDDAIMSNHYYGKDISRLMHDVDSLKGRYRRGEIEFRKRMKTTSLKLLEEETFVQEQDSSKLDEMLNADSLFRSFESREQLSIIKQAQKKAREASEEIRRRVLHAQSPRLEIRKHYLELNKKFTLSFACLVFFFIGAPLGSIIRKGGFGLPVVVSILLFIIYYIIDSFGRKFALEGVLDIWLGVWLSSIILLIVGVFLTYQAVTDSVIMDGDSYKRFFKKLGLMFKKKSSNNSN